MDPDDPASNQPMSRAAIKKRVVAGMFWSAMDNWGQQLLGLVTLVILARLLGPEDFGLVAMATAITALMTMVVQDTFAEQLIRRRHLEDSDYDACFWLVIGLATILSAATVALARPIAGLFGEPQVAELLCWLWPLMVVGALSAVPNALLKRDLRFKPLAVRTSVSLIGGAAVGISMAVAGYGVWSLVAQQLVQAVLQVLVVWSACGWRPRFSFSGHAMAHVFTYGSKVLGWRLVVYGDENLPRLLVGLMLGAAAMGLFQIAMRLVGFLNQVLVWPVGMVTMPTVARVQDNPALVSQIVLTVTPYLAIFTYPGFVGLASVTPELIPAFLGDKWIGAIGATQMLVLTGLATTVINLNMQVMRALNRLSWQIILGIIKLAVTALAVVVVGRHGFEWIAAAVLACMLVFWPAQAWVFTRMTGVSSLAQHRRLLPIVAATAGMAVALYGWKAAASDQMSNLELLLSEVAVGAAAYVALLLLCARRIVWSLMRTVAAPST